MSKTDIKNNSLLPACIFPTTDPPPIDQSRWRIGDRIGLSGLSHVYENDVLRSDIVIYTGNAKSAIKRAQRSIIETYFSHHTQMIVNGVLMAIIHGEWQDIALIDFDPDYVPKQKPRTRSMFE